MDTRGRKRKRGPKKPKAADSPGAALEDSTAALETKAASLPTCNPQGPSGRTTGHGSTGVDFRSSSPGSDPRPFSSCSRLVPRRSPSPARISRQREHTEMQVLNERLSSHVDHVKQLQAENGRLRLQVEAMNDVIQRESRNMKLLHGSEIKTLQDLIDNCNEEKTALSTLYEEEKLERERLGAELWDKDAEVASLCEQLDALKAMSEDYHKLRVDFEAAEAAVCESRQDAERMSAELLKEKRSNRRLEEEASTNKERYLKEVEEASARFSQHIQNADQKLEEGYEAQVSSALTSLRQQHIRDLEGLKAELTTNYQSKINEWKSACELAQADLLGARREVKATRQEHDRFRDMVTQLKADKAALEVQVSETQARLEEVRDRAERDRCQAQREVALLSQEMAEQREEMEEMGRANSRLEAEINAYRLIVEDLDGQNLNPTKEESKFDKGDSTMINKPKERKKKRTRETTTARKPKPITSDDVFDIFKRKDYFRTNDFSQGIEILDIDVQGRYITLVNTTDHPTDLCLWTVQQTDGPKIVKYQLDAATQLPKGKRLTLWSCDAGPGVDARARTTGSNKDKDDNNGGDDKGNSDKDDDDGCNEVGDKHLDRGVEVTMLASSWLKLDHRLTVRVEDGDGQLQAKCDISSITDTGTQVRGSGSATTSITHATASHSASTTTFLTANNSNSSSSSSKRPRLGRSLYPPNTSNNNMAMKGRGVGMSSSETRFNKAASAPPGRGRSSRAGSPVVGRRLGKGEGAAAAANGSSFSAEGGGVSDAATHLATGELGKQRYDKDSCRIA